MGQSPQLPSDPEAPLLSTVIKAQPGMGHQLGGLGGPCSSSRGILPTRGHLLSLQRGPAFAVNFLLDLQRFPPSLPPTGVASPVFLAFKCLR